MIRSSTQIKIIVLTIALGIPLVLTEPALLLQQVSATSKALLDQ